jgi:hypothetical protein
MRGRETISFSAGESAVEAVVSRKHLRVPIRPPFSHGRRPAENGERQNAVETGQCQSKASN